MPPASYKLNTGQEIPIVGFGTWQAAPGEVAKAVETALKSGYKLIDAAYCYGNEDEVGQGLKAAFAAGIKREDIFVMTKLWNTYSTRAELGLEKSLKALGLDYVDLYLVHWPCGMRGVGGWSPKGPEAADRFPMLKDDPSQRDMLWDHDHVQTWKAMEGLLESGKTRAIGVCNYSKVYLEQLLKHCSVKPAVNQLENHPFLPQQETVDFCRSQGIHVIAFSPFGSTGAPLMKADPVLEVAKRKQVGPGCILLSYAVARGNTVLAMATKEEWIKDNLRIVDLDAADMKLLNSIVEAQGPRRFVYPPFGIDFGFPDKPGGKRMPNGV